MPSIFAIIVFFMFLSWALKSLGKSNFGKQVKKSGGTAVAIFILLCTGLLPIALLVYALSAASKKNGSSNQNNRYQRMGNPNNNVNPYQSNPQGTSPASGTSPYGSYVNNYRVGMSNNPATNYTKRPAGYGAQNGAYYTGYTTRPMAGTTSASYQDQARNMSNAYNNAINYSGIYNNQKPNSYGLPSAEKKRTKIVKKFSEKYDLYLTDREIKRIVDASYLSSGWAREICYMNQKYDTVYAWYASMNPWLKVYLYAFQQQEISSDFAMQERIVYDAFNTVFSDVCNESTLTIDQAIRKINEKYLTNFDETTFMIAYRYMESKGKKYSFAFNQVLNTREDIDELLQKYENVQQGTPTPLH